MKFEKLRKCPTNRQLRQTIRESDLETMNKHDYAIFLRLPYIEETFFYDTTNSPLAFVVKLDPERRSKRNRTGLFYFPVLTYLELHKLLNEDEPVCKRFLWDKLAYSRI